jgi:hypothetical protein
MVGCGFGWFGWLVGFGFGWCLVGCCLAPASNPINQFINVINQSVVASNANR